MKKRTYLRVFLVNFAIAFCCFALPLLAGKGAFALTNDINTQMTPFLMFSNRAIKSGDIFWNWYYELGTDFVGAMSYYTLGSPFAWLTFLFPARFTPYLTGWVYMLKYATAALTAFLYLKRFTGETAASVGATLYAFSGFQSVNLMFYIFHDVVAFFPLLLVGYETLAREKKRGVFALTVALSAFLNYYFFTQEVIFLILYHLCREGVHLKKNARLIGACFLEGVIGVLQAGILFVPSMLFILGNPRTGEFLSPQHWFIHGNREILQILRTFLFPNDIILRGAWIRDVDFSSRSAYLPMVGIVFVVSYVVKRRRDWLSVLLIVCAVMSAVPVLNSTFALFLSANTHRWLFMFILMMCLATAQVLEDRKQYPVMKVGLALVVFLVVMVGGAVWWDANRYQLIFSAEVFRQVAILGVLGVCVVLALEAFCKSQRAYLAALYAGVVVFAVVTTASSALQYQKCYYLSPELYNDYLQTQQKIAIPDERYRVFSTDNLVTNAAYLSATGAFTSTIEPSIYPFYDSLERDRGFYTPMDVHGLRELLGGRYVVSPPDEADETVLQTVDGNYVSVHLTEIENALTIGAGYTEYLTETEFLSAPARVHAILMLKCIVAPDEKEAIVSQTLTHYEGALDESLLAKKDAFAAERAAHGVDTFQKGTITSVATITMPTDGYVFFSVPYTENFSAYVNGARVDILNDNHLIAVPVSAGENTITLRYFDASRLIGLLCTLAGWTAWRILRFKVHVVTD